MESVIYEIVKLKQELRLHEDLAPMNARSCYSLATWLQEEIGYDSQENFVVLCLDAKSNLTCFSIVHKGTVNTATVHPRDIFQRAILSNAYHIIIAHNHPSNNPKPSPSDTALTQVIKDVGELLSIPLTDHIIVGTDRYFSFKEQSYL
ncbi:JAB domain-containing protein [Enterococcus sp. 5H]|uniref:JAB domain-containing protein n=1 Tax=Enterococcus sp. 5H TaxID=1229490 RepID=UPI002303CBE2|nr:JAB domain-containing protein [Enterococcus sp. 5H]MDA9469879.1 DNA repair protein RadC [Enterococcus sp. 5H]